MRVFITGISCVGKTTIGSKLAELLDCCFFDLDDEIEKFFSTSIEKMQNQFLSMHSFRQEASKALIHLLNLNTNKKSVIALPPSGLMSYYWRVIKKTEGITIVLEDKPHNILDRITFYDKDSNLIEKHLTANQKSRYLSEIKKDITYYKRSYQRANIAVDISGLSINQSALKMKQAINQYISQ